MLNGILAEIAEVTDIETAMRLAARFGGTHIEIPKKPSDKSPLTQAVGLEAAKIISKKLGHGRLLIPMGPARGEAARRMQVAKMLDKGESVTIAARSAGVHERTVWRIKKNISGTLPLFDTEDG